MATKGALKLPEEPTKKKGKGGKAQLPKLPKGEVYTRIEMKELKQLVGPKPTYPLVLDFGSTEFQLETADFLLNASNVFKECGDPLFFILFLYLLLVICLGGGAAPAHTTSSWSL